MPYFIDFPDFTTNLENVLNKVTNEINDKTEKYKIVDFKISLIERLKFKISNFLKTYFSGNKFINVIKLIVIIKNIIETLKLSTSSWSNVLELSFLLSWLYKFFENGEVAIIDSAVIVKPVVIERNVAIASNAFKFRFNFIEKSKMINNETQPSESFSKSIKTSC